MALKLLEFVARLTDAYTLTLIRDIDPQAAKRATREAAEEVIGAAEEEEASRRSSRATATRSSMQSGRLLRELSRYSLHERLSEGLLLELAHTDLVESRAVCMEGLERCMYFYTREPQPFMLHCLDEALAALDAQHAGALRDRLAAWQRELRQRYPAMTLAEQPLASIPPQLTSAAAPAGVKTEVKRERDLDYFDVASIVGPRKRARN